MKWEANFECTFNHSESNDAQDPRDHFHCHFGRSEISSCFSHFPFISYQIISVQL